ncbi:glutathione peroxidase [soil metagenome]
MNVHDFAATTIEGNSQPLADYAGQVLLIVNVASKCGLTPQYEGLEALHRSETARGLQILGFPCNQFAGQEPGTDEEIADFCSTTFDVTFPIFSKVEVNGADADPLYAYLRAEAPGNFGPENGALYDYMAEHDPDKISTDDVKWNFTKFLVSRDGDVIKRYEPTVTPEEIHADLDTYMV